MSQPRRQALLVGVLLVLLALAALWSFGFYADAAAAAHHAAIETGRSADAARQIHALRRRPTLDGVHELDDAQLGALLADAAQQTGLTPGRVIRDVRRAGRDRVAEVYWRVRTTVRLDGVTLEELIRFAHALVTENPGLSVESLNLTVASGGASGGASRSGDESGGGEARWAAEPLELSYLVYDPRPRTGELR